MPRSVGARVCPRRARGRGLTGADAELHDRTKAAALDALGAQRLGELLEAGARLVD
jgi:hypothetical protein